MSSPAYSSIAGKCLGWIYIVLMLLTMGISSVAGVAAGPVLTNAVAAGQHRISIAYEAQKSYQEKLEVGRERYKAMLANRTNIIAGMTSELAARRQTVDIPSENVVDAKKTEPQTWAATMLGIGAIIIVFLGFRYFLSRQESKAVLAGRKI